MTTEAPPRLVDQGYYDIRLANGGTGNGILEVYLHGRWGEVCYNSPIYSELQPVCRYLGYDSLDYVSPTYTGAMGSLREFRCIDRDVYRLDNCTGMYGAFYCQSKLYINCGRHTSTEMTTEETSFQWTGRPSGIRLVDGYHPWEGRVELYVNGHWGTICDDDFDNVDAGVICFMLGYSRNGYAYASAKFGSGTGSILLDDLQCYGYENDISECRSSGWYKHNCGHSEDAGVSCSGGHLSSTTESHTTEETSQGVTGIRLVGGSYPWEGRVEVYHNHQWGTICDDSFDKQDAQVICAMLGYYRYGSITAYDSAAFGQGSGPIMLDDLHCSGYESDISQCGSGGWLVHNCGHGEDASVSCQYPVSREVSTTYPSWHEITTNFHDTSTNIGYQGHIPLRLTYGHEGFLEVYHNGRWGNVCYNNQDIGRLVYLCDYLGYHRYAATVDYRYTSSNAILENLQCPYWWNGDGLDTCSGKFNDYGVGCYYQLYISCGHATTTEPTTTVTSVTTNFYDTSTHKLGYQGHIPVRLTFGHHGFLEVYHNGRWGYVCYNNQDRHQFDYLCQYLGFERFAQFVDYRYTSSNVILLNLNCPSWWNTNGIDDCNGYFNDAGNICYSSLYIYCDYATTTERITTISTMSGCTATSPADVVFVVDESGSVGTENFNWTRYSIADTIGHLGISGDFIRVGVMTFDDNSRTIFNLNSYPGNVYSMENSVKSMSYSSGGTNIANALSTACGNMFTSNNGDRPNAQNYLVLLTDGQSDAAAAQSAANSCKASGTKIISVGIGSSIDDKLLRNIAYNIDYYLNTNYSDITSFLPRLVTTAVNCGGLETTDAKHVEVNCQHSNWYIKLRLPAFESKYPDFKDSDIYLGVDSCTGYRSGDYLIFSEDYTTCGTQKTTSPNGLIYSNTLIYAVHDPVQHFIVREYRFKITVECDMSKIESGHNNVNNNHGQLEEQTVAGIGHFAVQLKFYGDGRYQNEFNGFPPSYMIGEKVYVKVETPIHDYDVKMRLTDCFTKPTESSSDIYIYYLIKNGCPSDPNAVITSQSTHETRFYFQDFEYANHPNSMYVHCNATFCNVNDYSRACEPQCSHQKRTESRGSEVTNGPIGFAEKGAEILFNKGSHKLRKRGAVEAKITEHSWTNEYIIGGVMVVIAMLAIVVVVYKKTRNNHTGLPMDV